MISKDNLKNILAFLTPVLLFVTIEMSMLDNHSVSDIINYYILSIYLFTVLLYIHYKYWLDGSFILFVVVIILHIIIKIINFIKKSPKHERFINCTNI